MQSCIYALKELFLAKIAGRKRKYKNNYILANGPLKEIFVNQA